MDIEFRENTLEVAIGCLIVRPRPTSFRLLRYLAGLAGRWAPADELREHVLRTHVARGASNVRWHVLEARAALGTLKPFLHSDLRLGFKFDLETCRRSHCAHRGMAGSPIEDARFQCGLSAQEDGSPRVVERIARTSAFE